MSLFSSVCFANGCTVHFLGYFFILSESTYEENGRGEIIHLGWLCTMAIKQNAGYLHGFVFFQSGAFRLIRFVVMLTTSLIRNNIMR